MRRKINPTPTFKPAIVTLLMLWCLLAASAIFLAPNAVALTGIICLAGNIVGIPLGMIASPLEREGSHFRAIGGWIASFFSGYLVSKLELLDTSLFLKDQLSMGRTLLFFAFMILGAVSTFVLRSYLDPLRPLDSYGPSPDLPSGAGEQATQDTPLPDKVPA